MTRLVVYISLLLSAVLVIACSNQDHKGRLIVALDGEPRRLNPLFLTDLNSHMVSNLIFRGLTSIDSTGQPTPELAESWSISKDGKTVLFRLKKDVYWHDGVKFTAKDVDFTYRLLSDPKVGSPRLGTLGPIDTVEVLDEQAVKITYKNPYGPLLYAWSIGMLPSHLGKERVLSPDFDKQPIGNGPYSLRHWTAGQFIELRVFDGYQGKEPSYKKLLLRFIAEPTTRELELKARRIDVAELPVSITIDDKNLRRYTLGSFRYTCLGLNLNKGPFKEERLRIALSYAIDKESLIRVALQGIGKVSTGPYPTGAWYFNDKVEPYRYDPQLSRQLLKGLVDEGFSFNLYVSSENRELQRAAQFIKEALNEVGITVKITTYEWQTLRHRLLVTKDFEAVLLSRAYLWEPDLYDLWHSSKTKEGDWNFFFFKDAEVDALLERGRRAVNFDEQKQIYRELHRLLYKKQSCIYLYETPLVFYASNRVKVTTANPQGMLYGIETWH